MVRTVVVTTVKRASVTDPQRFSKEFNAIGVWPATQRRKNCIYNEGDVVKNHLNFVKVVPITYLNFIVIVIEVSKKKKKKELFFIPTLVLECYLRQLTIDISSAIDCNIFGETLISFNLCFIYN